MLQVLLTIYTLFAQKYQKLQTGRSLIGIVYKVIFITITRSFMCFEKWFPGISKIHLNSKPTLTEL